MYKLVYSEGFKERKYIDLVISFVIHSFISPQVSCLAQFLGSHSSARFSRCVSFLRVANVLCNLGDSSCPTERITALRVREIMDELIERTARRLGRAIAQAVSRWLPTTAARVQTRV
jgi:hypothetical protein